MTRRGGGDVQFCAFDRLQEWTHLQRRLRPQRVRHGIRKALVKLQRRAPISPYVYLPPPPHTTPTHLLQHLHRQLRRNRPARYELVEGVRQCHAEAGRVPFERQTARI